MNEAEAKTYFDRNELDLINDITTAVHTQTASPASRVDRPRLISLLRRVLVNSDRLGAYCRLLIDRKGDVCDVAIGEAITEQLIKNNLEGIGDADLLKLAADVDALSVLHDLLHEGHREEWVDAVIEDGAAHIRKTGATFKSAEEMLREVGVPGDANPQWVEELEIVPLGEAIRVRKGGPSVEGKAGQAGESLLWRIQTRQSSIHIVLPPSIAQRCYGVSEQSIEILLELVKADEQADRATVRAAIRPAPTHGSFILILHLPDAQSATVFVDRSPTGSVSSNESNVVSLRILFGQTVPTRLEFR